MAAWMAHTRVAGSVDEWEVYSVVMKVGSKAVSSVYWMELALVCKLVKK